MTGITFAILVFVIAAFVIGLIAAWYLSGKKRTQGERFRHDLSKTSQTIYKDPSRAPESEKEKQAS